jgi:hypothetical protein
MTVSWEEMKRGMKELIKEELQSQPPQQREIELEKPQESASDHICSCPSCLCDTIEKLNLTSDYMCTDCHLPLGSKAMTEKLEMCPNCGSTSKPREITQDMKDGYRKKIAGKSIKR